MELTRETLIDNVDVEKSLKYNELPILITQDGYLLTTPENEFDLSIKEIESKENLKGVKVISPELLDQLKEELLSLQIVEETTEVEVAEEEEDIDTSEVRKTVDSIILFGIRRGASDIHIDPKETYYQITFRITGEVVPFKRVSKGLGRRVVQKLKLLANLDINETHIPQDGKIKVKVGGINVELRLSTNRGIFGENAVLRVQRSSEVYNMTLDDVGFEKEDLETYRESFKAPYGAIFNVGGTGEGKTTTLYLTLKELYKLYGDRKRMMSVEDPVEVNFPFLFQVEVDEKRGRTFARVLKAFLRQDPDVILVGEVRDPETAETCMRASITGHLVLSTLHATDTFNAFLRLKDLGVSPIMIASSVSVILSQRLVRRNCPYCRVKEKIPEEIVKKYKLDFDYHYVGKGCDKCDGTGIAGRTAVIEVLRVDEGLKKLLSVDANVVELKTYAKERGFRNLWTNGLEKVKIGEVSLPELLSKIKPDEIVNSEVFQRSEVEVGVSLYPDKFVPVEVYLKGKTVKGFLFDVLSEGLSIIFDKTIVLPLNVPVKAKLTYEGTEREFTFVPKNIRHTLSHSVIVGGRYRGDVLSLFAEV